LLHNHLLSSIYPEESSYFGLTVSSRDLFCI